MELTKHWWLPTLALLGCLIGIFLNTPEHVALTAIIMVSVAAWRHLPVSADAIDARFEQVMLTLIGIAAFLLPMWIAAWIASVDFTGLFTSFMDVLLPRELFSYKPF